MLRDLLYSIRMMRRRPAFNITAILSLTLGIGANTAVFGLVDSLFLKSLPVHRPHELVRLVEENRQTSTTLEAFTYPTYEQLRRSTRALSDVIVMSDISGPGRIVERDEEFPAFVQFVSDNYFDALGIQASQGRVFHEPTVGAGNEPAAVISDAFWRAHYGASPSALGASLRVNNREFTVGGITPREFRGTSINVPVDVWIPLEQVVRANSIERTRGRWLQITGRLAPGQNRAIAQAEATSILRRPVQFLPGGAGYSNLRGRLFRPLLLLELMVVLVLLLTCANLAHLKLAETSSREHELDVRRAIGASRSRLVRQLFGESFVPAVLGGALSVVVAYWISASLTRFLPPEQAPSLANLQFEPNLRMLSFAAFVSLATCILFGMAPALRTMRAPSRHRAHRSLNRGLVVSEVAMCTLVMIVGGLFLRTVQNLRSQDSGYREDGLLVADVGFPRLYAEDRRDGLIEQLSQRAAVLPGVEAVGFSQAGQLSGRAIEYSIHLPENSDSHDIFEQRVSPGFIEAMGTRLTSGRDFSHTDTADSTPVAIVNQAFARRFGLETNPIGRRFVKEGGSRKMQSIEIIGVVADAKWINLRQDSPAMYYVPYLQNAGTPVVRFAIRADGDLNVVAASLLQAARDVDPRMTLSNVVPFSEIVNRSLMIERLLAQVSTVFALLALLIAATGLYGILAYDVVRRRREIGVRIAIGARPRAIEWMILRESLALLTVGFAIGVPAAVFISRFVSVMLFGLSPRDPLTIAATLAVLTFATVVAAYLPARRASALDPAVTLREN